MRDLQRRIDELRRRLQNLTDAAELPVLERTARELLSDARNTPYEQDARTLFSDVAKRAAPAPATNPTVRGLLRRAKIRLEMAGDVDDIDEAIDILTEALAIDTHDEDVIGLLRQAAGMSSQAIHRVRDLFNRYNVTAELTPPPDVRATSTSTVPAVDIDSGNPMDAPPRYVGPGSAPMTPPSAIVPVPSQAPANDLNTLFSRLSESYYAGDYQLTVDTANRILAIEPSNLTAKEYRQKAEDNLIRGIVPDHRIPFEARVAYNRANSLVRAGNYDEAARLYREARELAERAGILTWKDVEQALLDIQDLALAREFIIEGDRLMANDSWAEAQRKYEGALRIVAGDPQAAERVEMVQKVQADTNQISVQLNMIGGSLEDQVAQIQTLRNLLAQARQLLPTSTRLAQLQRDTDARVNAVRNRLNEQAAAALDRARSSTALEDRLKLTEQALKLMEYAVELDPADSTTASNIMEARAASQELARARQMIERASTMAGQNLDQEVMQARMLLAGLPQASQDERYRMVVNEVLSRYIERVEQALEMGDMAEAQNWLAGARDDPFRILGRRSEIYRLDNVIRFRRNQRRALAAVIGGFIILALFLCTLFTRSTWQPALFPTVTPSITPLPTQTPTLTPTASLTPSETPLPSETYTASPSPTPSLTPTSSLTPTITQTPTWTWTPSPTWTPSWTPTASLTPTASHTPTETPTSTETSTPSSTPTLTMTPTISPTPPELCRLAVNGANGVFMRDDATTNSPVVAVLAVGQEMDALERKTQVNRLDGALWYRVRVNLPDGTLYGWVRTDVVREVTPCPPLP